MPATFERRPIYLDNHATTRVDPRVLEAMLPCFTEAYGNAGSVSHAYGAESSEIVENAREEIARGIGATPREIVFTSGATESNHLALEGIVEARKEDPCHVLSVTTEHRSILDPLERLALRGHSVTLLEVEQGRVPNCGLVDVDRVRAELRPNTRLVVVALANNEIGVIQPLAEIAEICRGHGALLHCDATQAVGKLARPVDVMDLGVDFLAFSAHKIYGPKGVGALFVRRGDATRRLRPQVVGGGQERGRRGGTLNTPGIAGFAKALSLCLAERESEGRRIYALRERLFMGIVGRLQGVHLNGPGLWPRETRLAGNLNLGFEGVDGDALLRRVADKIAVSSGSACTSANPEPSHVLRALGVPLALSKASLRFGLGRFNTEAEIDLAIEAVVEAVSYLRGLSPARDD